MSQESETDCSEQLIHPNFFEVELIDDTQIPASVEEVIVVVTTGQPTVKTSVRVPQSVAQKSVCKSKRSKRKRTDNGKLQVTNKTKKLSPKRGAPDKRNSSPNRSKITNKDSLEWVTSKKKTLLGSNEPVNGSYTEVKLPKVFEGEEIVRIRKEGSESDEDSEIDIGNSDNESVVFLENVFESSCSEIKINSPVGVTNEETCVSDFVTYTSVTNTSTTETATVSAADNKESTVMDCRSDFFITHTTDSSVTVEILAPSIKQELSTKEEIENKLNNKEEETSEQNINQVQNSETGLVDTVSSYHSEKSDTLYYKSEVVDESVQKEEEEEEHANDEAVDKTKDVGQTSFCDTSTGKLEAEADVNKQTDPIDTIFHLSPPTEERILQPDKITDEERLIHREFFEGRQAKTPDRYLKIRNFILEAWNKSKPNYITKTSVRPGLKNCGDVNCIGRIHAYLEQIGGINFGCEQARYNRPLVAATATAREKPSRDELLAHQQARKDAMRPRKKKIPKEYFISLDGGGGYTIEHTKDGEMGSATHIPEQSRTKISRECGKNDPFKLVYCNEFSAAKPAPFSIELHSQGLTIMDLHAHCCHTEVIGLLGGHYSEYQGRLQILVAEPCRSISTDLQCEMCPVSQTEASEALQSQGLEVVGWYHSHPFFIPNPSVRDLETQQKFQDWFAKKEAPFVGFIISPFSPSNKTLASKYRCLIVSDDSSGIGNVTVPYKFEVTPTSTPLKQSELVERVRVLLEKQKSCSTLVPFRETYPSHPGITYGNKLFHSLKYHLKMDTPHEITESLLAQISLLFEEFVDQIQPKTQPPVLLETQPLLLDKDISHLQSNPLEEQNAQEQTEAVDVSDSE